MEKLDKIKNLYRIVCHGQLGDDPAFLQERVNIVRHLEKVTKQEFESTRDFLEKMDAFILKHEKSPGEKLREARKKKGYSLGTLALLLEVSGSYQSQMENNRKPLNDKAVAFILDVQNVRKPELKSR